MSPTSPSQPSLPWRATSSFVMGVTGFLSRSFLFGFSYTEVIGLDRFLEVLDGRKDVSSRDKGLLTGTYQPIILGKLAMR
jgi:monolysocardiolipin acyltransferase